MTDSRSKPLKRQRLSPRHRDIENEEVTEPLRSTQRSDGVWESIEIDDDAVLLSPANQQDEAAPFSARAAQSPTTTQPSPRRPLMSSHIHQDTNSQNNVKSTGTQTTDEPRNVLPTPTTTPPTATAPEPSRPPTPTRADLIARVLHCPLPHPGLNLPLPITSPAPLPPAALEGVQEKGKKRPPESVPSSESPPLLQTASPEPTAPPPRRRRGRPKKAQAHGPAPAPAPATTPQPQPPPPRRPRRVRFSEPAPPEAEPALRSRDSHVFVRLVRVVVVSTTSVAVANGGEDASSSRVGGGRSQSRSRREEFVWNNRGKGWKRSAGAPGGGGGGRVGEEGLLDLVGLFGSAGGARPAGGGVGAVEAVLLLRPVVVPTEGAGVQQPVEMAWDEGRFCFQGVNAAGETLSVTLGEMRESARDPWARQFVGYVMQ